MIGTVVAIILGLGAIGSVLAGGVYFYWRLLDRRLTDVSSRQSWFQENYEGDDISGNFAKGTITKIRCYTPNTAWGKLKRYSTFDAGRTRVTLALQPPVPDHFWDELKDLIEEEGVEVIRYNDRDRRPASYIEMEIHSLDKEEFDRLAGYPVEIVEMFLENQTQ